MKKFLDKSVFHGLIFSILILFVSCKKLVSVDPPRDAITEEKMFQSEKNIENAMTGIYSKLINEPRIKNTFSSWYLTFAGGTSSNEFNANNKLWMINRTNALGIWTSAYEIIYLCNSVLEGIDEFGGQLIKDAVKRQYMGEARLLRAFSFLYLINFFGDIPLVLTADFNETRMMPRTPVSDVYNQIKRDLQFAEENLPLNFDSAEGKRIRANAWIAKALLARASLYEGDYEQAAAYATEIINQAELFQLEPLSRVFLANSKEAIFQFMQWNQSTSRRNATPEGYYFLPNPLHTGRPGARLSLDLVNQFEPGDQRRVLWVDSTLQTDGGQPADLAWYPSKYKVGPHNAVLGAPSTEYYMVMRLAELYLIRAEARAYGADGGPRRSIEDLNVLRNRAGLGDLQADLSTDEVQNAVWQERRIELFAEWGHYWIDLRRSGRAVEVLSKIPAYMPWEGDWQLLYPIPESEIYVNKNLKQNPGYDEVREY